MLDGILRCENQKRLRQFVGFSTNGDLLFLHRFQQRGLHLRRCTVYLIGKDDVRKQRSAFDMELARLLIEHHRSDDVCGKQIGCKLDTVEHHINRLGQRGNRQGLR